MHLKNGKTEVMIIKALYILDTYCRYSRPMHMAAVLAVDAGYNTVASDTGCQYSSSVHCNRIKKIIIKIKKNRIRHLLK